MASKTKSFINLRLRILLGTNAVIMTAGAMLGPIYALFVEEIGGNILDAGLTYAVYAVVSGIVMIVSGNFSDRFRLEKATMNIGYLLLALAFLLYLKVDSVQNLFLVQVVLGIGQAIYYPAYDSLFSQNLVKGHYGLEWGIDEAKGFFSEALGATLGGFIAFTYGFDVLFICMSCLCLGAMLYSSSVLKT